MISINNDQVCIDEQKDIRIWDLPFLLILLITIINMTPYLSREIPLFLQAFFIIIWLAFLIIKMLLHKKPIKRFDLNFSIFIFLFIFLESSYKLLGVSSAEWGNYAISIIFFITGLMMMYVYRNYTLRQKRFFAWAIVFVMLYNIIDNIRIGTFLGDEYINAYKNNLGEGLNVASTSFSTAVVLFTGIILIVLLNTNSMYKKVFAIFIIGTSIYYTVTVASRGTNFILLIFMIGCILFANLYKRKLSKQVLIITGIFMSTISFLILFLGGDVIFSFIASHISNERIANRVQSISIFLARGSLDETGGSLAARIYLAQTSIETFTTSLKTFFLGIGDHRYTSVYEAYSIGIGGHSQIIDMLAKYGLIGAILVIGIFHKWFYLIKRIFQKKEYWIQTLIVILIFVVRSFWGNTFYPEVSVIIFFLIPLLPSLIE